MYYRVDAPIERLWHPRRRVVPLKKKRKKKKMPEGKLKLMDFAVGGAFAVVGMRMLGNPSLSSQLLGGLCVGYSIYCITRAPL